MTKKKLACALLCMLLPILMAACGANEQPARETTLAAVPESTAPVTAAETTEIPPVQPVLPMPLETEQNEEICEYYAIDRTGNAVYQNNYACTSYLNCYDASTLTLRMAQRVDGDNYGLAFYDAAYKFLSFVPGGAGEAEAITQTVEIPDGACYFRTTYFCYSERKSHAAFAYALLDSTGKAIDLTAKRPYQSEFIYFSQEVNQSLDPDDTQNMNVTTGVLALPENYTPTGEKTKLIVYFHGYSHYVYYGKWGNTDNFVKQKRHFMDEGFAVLDCNGARNNQRKGQFSSAGSPQFVNAYWQCVEYALEHYNLDDQIYVIGGSAGGTLSINFTDTHKENVRGLVLLSAWYDLATCEWGQGYRAPYVEFLGFKNTQVYEKDKAELYDPYLRLKQANKEGTVFLEGVEVTLCYGSKEGSSWEGRWHTFIHTLRKQKPDTVIREFDGRDHTRVVSGADPEVDRYITDFFKGLT